MRLLVVEDDDRVAAALAGALGRHGFDVARARTGAGALEMLSPRPDLVLLDLGLPDHDGFEICTRIRRTSTVPIIIVTARAEQASRLRGLYTGADDYVVKPYDLRELLARIHAVVRRAGGEAARARERRADEHRPVLGAPAGQTGAENGLVRVGTLLIDPGARQVTVDGREVALTRKEFDLLAQLARAPGVAFRREQIFAEVWGYGWQGTSHTLDVHVASLRDKLGVRGMVETVRGVGYRLAVQN
jgi:DNA-binding response OmpR family regulator